MSVQQEKFKEIANVIRKYLATDDLIKPNDFASKISEAVNYQMSIAYSSGKSEGFEEQQTIIDGYLADFAEIKEAVNVTSTFIYDNTPTSDYAEKVIERCTMDFQMALNDGIEQGKQSAYDEFWDSYQSNGSRTNYQNGFAGVGWTLETFKPKHPICPYIANAMFQFSNIRGDLGAILLDLDVEFNTSNMTNFDYAFYGTSFTALPIIDMSKSTTTNYMSFGYNHQLKKIEKIILNASGTQTFRSTFWDASALEEVAFEGVIGNSLDMSYSPLNRASIESIVGCLSSTATGKTLTLNKAAKEAAFTDEEWTTLTANKTNWTINLI